MSQINVEGNLTADPVLRFTPQGTPVCEFSIAENRTVERDGKQVPLTDFYDVKAWRMLGENVASSLSKGDRVIVTGRLERRQWEDERVTPSITRYRYDLVAFTVGVSLRFARVDALVKTAGRGVSGPADEAEPEYAMAAGDEPF